MILSTIGNSFGENSLYVGIGESFGFIFSDLISHRLPRKMGIFYTLAATSLISISFMIYPIPSSCEGEDKSCW